MNFVSTDVVTSLSLYRSLVQLSSLRLVPVLVSVSQASNLLADLLGVIRLVSYSYR